MPFLKLDDYTIPGYGLNVGFGIPLKEEDASGESSSTASAGKGKKAKKLDVRCRLPYRQVDDLRELTRMAEATEDNGDSKIYTITNETANAAGIRQAVFSGNLRADQSQNLLEWNISFALAEKNSVPEMAEGRLPARQIGTQTSEGETIAPPPVEEEAAPEQEPGWLEKMLKAADKALGPEEE